MGRPGGACAPPPPQFLADQLTLSQPGGTHSPTTLLRADPDFQTLRRPWYISTYLLDVLWCQPIKLIQVVSTSEFHEY